MVKERIKTFLLLSLVCISFFLTRRLWIKMPYEILPFLEKEETLGANYLLEDMIKPHKYLLNFNRESHSIYYNDDTNHLWTSTRSILTDVLSSNSVKIDTVSNEDFLSYNEKRSIVFYFPEKFNTYIISRSLDITKPNIIAEKIPEIDSIYFYLGKENPFFVFSQGEKHLKVYNLNIETDSLRDQLKTIEEKKDFTHYYPIKDTLGFDNNLFISYEMAKTMPTIYVENELNVYDIDKMRSIAENFFNKNIDYLREIIEDNGSVIYLYNQQVLKINHNGQLEYFNPLEEPVPEKNLYISLNTAAEFLSENMDIPRDMYLVKIEEIESDDSEGYRFNFRYKVGEFPIILGSDTIEDFIQIDVFNKHIRNYKRLVRKNMKLVANNIENEKKILSSFEIINMNYNLLESEYIKNNNLILDDIKTGDLMEEVIASIQNINIAYVDPCLKDKGEKLIGVWVLEMEDKLYAFDVHNGCLILTKGKL